MRSPEDYIEATRLYNHQIRDCLEWRDNVQLVHRYPGKYYYLLECYITGLYERKLKLIEADHLDESMALNNYIVNTLIQSGTTLSYRIFANGKVLVNEERITPCFYGWKDGAQELICFSYNVPNTVPLNQSVLLEYEWKNCTKELLDSLGDITIRIREITQK